MESIKTNDMKRYNNSPTGRLIIIFIITVVCVMKVFSQSKEQFIPTLRHEYTKEFIADIWDESKRLQDSFNIPMAITLGIAVVESNHGRSRRYQEDNNVFGLKSRKTLDYGVYRNRADCFAHYKRSMQQRCYRENAPETLNDWYEAMELCNWATGIEYTHLLNAVIFDNGFDKITNPK